MIRSIAHIAIPAADAEAMITFYGALGCNLLGVEEWRAGRVPGFAVQFGPSKINIHPPARWPNGLPLPESVSSSGRCPVSAARTAGHARSAARTSAIRTAT